MRTRTRVAELVVCLAVGVTGLAACGGTDDEVPSDFCKAVANLESSVERLQQDEIARSNLPALRESLSGISSAVTTLFDNASTEFATEVDAVDAQAQKLGTTVRAAVASPTPDTVNAVRESARAFATSVEDLSEAVSGSC